MSDYDQFDDIASVIRVQDDYEFDLEVELEEDEPESDEDGLPEY